MDIGALLRPADHHRLAISTARPHGFLLRLKAMGLPWKLRLQAQHTRGKPVYIRKCADEPCGLLISHRARFREDTSFTKPGFKLPNDIQALPQA